MNEKLRKKLIIIDTILIIVLILGLSYAAFVHSKTEDNENSYMAACYDVTYDESEGIEIENTMPLTDEEGMMQKAYKLKMTNNCQKEIGYKVILNILNESSTPNDLMKVSINSLIQNVNELEKVDKKEEYQESYKIIANKLQPNESVDYEIRSWMKEESESGEGTSFENKISVELSSFEKVSELNKIILANNKLQIITPDFSKGYPNSKDNDSSKSGLYVTKDDMGISHYFRGDKKMLNHYVTFAKMKWKIIRINGDGTIRLLLDRNLTYQGNNRFKFNDYESSSTTSQHEKVGFTYNNTNPCTNETPCEIIYNKDTNEFFNANFEGTNSNIKEVLEGWYQENLAEYDEQIAYGLFCNDTSYYSGTDDGSTSTIRYGGYGRVFHNPQLPSLNCPDPTKKDGTLRTYGGIYKTKIGLMSADETSYAGSKNGTYDTNNDNYLQYTWFWWLMTPEYSNNEACQTRSYVALYYNTTTNDVANIRPVINLKPDVSFTTSGAGEPGSSTNPYTISS